MTYAIVKTGGKQYRVEEGQTLLVERLREDEGAKVSLDPLMYRDDKQVLDGSDLAKVKVEAKVVGHERGPKIHVLKFKPKRGYKRRTGHRQELTRIEVTGIKVAARRAPAKKPAADAEEKPKPARKPPARKPAASRAKKEDSDGS
jgi:large subunit ribosomal protein L21